MVKIKRDQPRENFKNSQLVNDISGRLLQLESTALDKKEFYKDRTKIYEIIAIMWLDDFHDNYLDAIDSITNNIKTKCFPYNNVTKDGLIKFFRDSTGISNYIDVAKIFKFFIKNRLLYIMAGRAYIILNSYPFYIDLINNQVVNYYGDLEIMNTVLVFINSLIQNKFTIHINLVTELYSYRAQRLTFETNSQIGYKLFKDLSKMLTQYSNSHLIYAASPFYNQPRCLKTRWRTSYLRTTASLIKSKGIYIWGQASYICSLQDEDREQALDDTEHLFESQIHKLLDILILQ